MEARAIIELLTEGSISSFDTSIVLRFSGRKDDERDIQFFTGPFKLSPKLRTPIDLDREDREGADFKEAEEELSRR